ncbi:unnamed protein product, partial [Prorocentrum cordatum]
MEAWARALQLVKEQDRRALGSAFAAARERLSASGPESLAGGGPASAAALAAVRLGWRPDRIRRWTDDLGRILDLGEIDKHMIHREVQAAFIRKLWRGAASHDPLLGHLKGGAAINSLRKRLARRCADHALASRWSSARNAIVGCLWQWKLDDLNIRYFYDTGGPLDSDAEHAIWSRCLAQGPRSDLPLPLTARIVRTTGPRAGEPLHGEVFLDGSAIHVQDRVPARAGWAACSTDHTGAE